MKVFLHREDLKPEFSDMPCSVTRFEHFSNVAQALMLIAGFATFEEHDKSEHNIIYSPKPAPVSGDNNIVVSGKNNVVIRK